MAAGTVVAGLACGALVAAGADPYAYVSQSLLWANGNPVQAQTPLALQAPWPDAAWTFCPLGYRPSYLPGLVVPTYAVGLPLQMAILARLAGIDGSFIVVPVLGGVAVWATYRLGLRVTCNQPCALLAALLTACSPVFLLELMQPMSDVAVTAWWLLSILAALDATYVGAIGAGLYASLAIATRPNLVLLALPLIGYVAWGDGQSNRNRWMRVSICGLAMIPGVLLTAAGNATFSGSPFVSGYGSLHDIYQLENAWTNLVRYPTWLYSTHSLLILIGLGSAIAAWGAKTMPPGHRRSLVRHGLLGGAFAIVLFASYLFYMPFDHWTYLRFLLPAIPVLLVLGVATVDGVGEAVSPRVRSAAFALVLIVLPLYYVSFARRGDAFALKRLFLDRYVTTARYVGQETSASAVIIGLNQTGSLRLYAHRLTVRYDLIPPDRLNRAINFFAQRGHPVYVALESTEEAGFRARFADAATLTTQQTVIADSLGLVRLTGPIEVPH